MSQTDEHAHDAHTPDHAGPAETIPEPSGPGTVMLEMGGDVGAAVVRTPASLDGEEIEIRAAADPWTGRHVAVRPRPLGPTTVYAAVFDGLSAGTYHFRQRFGPEGGTELVGEVIGARVVDLAWPGT
jgi:hypothetical protein